MLDFDQILQLIITLVLTPLLTWGVKTLIALLNAKIDQMKDETLKKALKDAQEELASAVILAVTETQETFVRYLKEEGKFDEVAAKEALEKSLARTKEIMSNAAMTVLEDATGALNALIVAQIENTVKEVKITDTILAGQTKVLEKE